MVAMASQITSLTIVYSMVYSITDQRKHQSSASLTFVWGIHRWPVNSLHKGPATWKMYPFDDVIMTKDFVMYSNGNKQHMRVNSFWPSGFIWRHRSGPTLAQVMPSCLMAPSHYLNQCWLVINGVLRHVPKSILGGSTREFNLQHELENYPRKIIATPGSHELMLYTSMFLNIYVHYVVNKSVHHYAIYCLPL